MPIERQVKVLHQVIAHFTQTLPSFESSTKNEKL